MKMISKKAQGEIITTVLIILLVLAAIVIVWQVVNRTVTTGGQQVTAGANCMGLSIAITNTSTGVTVKPNKDLEGYRVYSNGAMVSTATEDAMAVGIFTTKTFAYAVPAKAKLTAAGKIAGTWCDGSTEVIA
jgi:hypothetical protein